MRGRLFNSTARLEEALVCRYFLAGLPGKHSSLRVQDRITHLASGTPKLHILS